MSWLALRKRQSPRCQFLICKNGDDEVLRKLAGSRRVGVKFGVSLGVESWPLSLTVLFGQVTLLCDPRLSHLSNGGITPHLDLL